MRAGNWFGHSERDAQVLELHRTLSGGVRTSWQRDAQGRPTSQRISAGAGAAGPSRQRRYQWRAADQLVAIDDSLTGETRYGYDALGYLTTTHYPDGTQELREADAVGNLFRTRARTDRRYASGGLLREADGTRYRYDAEGNLLRKMLPTGQVWQYQWDGAGQLTQVKRPDGYAVVFTHDALGRRTSKQFRGRVTRWVWDADKPLHEWQETVLGPEAGSAGQVLTWLFAEDSFAPVAKLTAQAIQGELQKQGIDLTDLKHQARLLLRQTGKTQLNPDNLARQARATGQVAENEAGQAAANPQQADQSFDDVIDQLTRRAVRIGDAADRDAAVNVVMQRTGKSRAESEQIVDNWIATAKEAQAKLEQAKKQAADTARQAGDAAAVALSKAALLAALGLGLGAAVAAFGGWRTAPLPLGAEADHR